MCSEFREERIGALQRGCSATFFKDNGFGLPGEAEQRWGTNLNLRSSSLSLTKDIRTEVHPLLVTQVQAYYRLP